MTTPEASSSSDNDDDCSSTSSRCVDEEDEKITANEEEERSDDDDDEEAEDEEEQDAPKQEQRPVFRLDLTKQNDFNAKLAKRGVIYLPSMPKSMNPTILRQLLEPHGDITRLYLKPSDQRKQRSNNRKRYREGWVEFAKKSVAKRIAASLHQTTITNNKRSIMYGDLWSLKYLKGGFKWDHLTETIAYERRVREQKLRLEDMQARKEANVYKGWLEQNETLDYIQQRRKEKTDETTTSKKRSRKSKQPLNEQGAERATKKVLLESLL